MKNSNISKQNTLPFDLYERLKEDIISGRFPAGSKLSEQSICDGYNVSRTPVREAFQKLELEGIIEIIPNRGAFVCELSKQDILDAYEIMKSLMAVTARFAVERITDEEIAALADAFELMEFYTLKKDLRKLADVDEDFHRIINEASRSTTLVRVIQSCRSRVRSNPFRKVWGTDFLEDELAEHEAILMAMVARDKETAVAACVRHVRNAKKRADL